MTHPPKIHVHPEQVDNVDYWDNGTWTTTEGGIPYVPEMQWQPIETAPKDGTVVFVWHLTRINPHAAMDNNIKKAQWLVDCESWRVDGVGGNVEPVVTHWMPLPTAPEATK